MKLDPEKLGTPERIEKLKPVIAKRQPTLTIVMENIHDPHNVSACLRSCDATGVRDVHLVYTGFQKFPNLGERSSASARKWVEQHQYTSISDCYAQLRSEGKKIYTTHLSHTAKSIYELDFTEPIAIVLGNEHAGVTNEAVEQADGNVLIPQMGIVQSLNISVACAVTLFEAMRQRLAKGMYNQPQISDEEMHNTLCNWLMK